MSQTVSVSVSTHDKPSTEPKVARNDVPDTDTDDESISETRATNGQENKVPHNNSPMPVPRPAILEQEEEDTPTGNVAVTNKQEEHKNVWVHGSDIETSDEKASQRRVGIHVQRAYESLSEDGERGSWSKSEESSDDDENGSGDDAISTSSVTASTKYQRPTFAPILDPAIPFHPAAPKFFNETDSFEVDLPSSLALPPSNATTSAILLGIGLCSVLALIIGGTWLGVLMTKNRRVQRVRGDNDDEEEAADETGSDGGWRESQRVKLGRP